MAENTEGSVHDSTDSTKAVDRGKLIHVDDNTFSLFAEMELIFVRTLKKLQGKSLIIVNVLFAWVIVSTNSAKSLLRSTNRNFNKAFKSQKDPVKKFNLLVDLFVVNVHLCCCGIKLIMIIRRNIDNVYTRLRLDMSKLLFSQSLGL